MTPSWLANPQDEDDDPWMADPQFFRDCRFDPYNGGGWVVPRHRRTEFTDRDLPLKGSPGPMVAPSNDRVGMQNTRLLERQADRLLEDAYGRLRQGRRGKTGAMLDADHRKIFSLIGYDQTGRDVILGEPAERLDVSKLLDDLREVAGLTRSELVVVECIAEGGATRLYGWTDAVAQQLGKSPATIRMHWSNAKRKLLDAWAIEPKPHTRSDPRGPAEGTEVTPISSGLPPVFKWLPFDEIVLAVRAHVREAWRNADWDETPSLTPDGWHLWDDALWATR